MTTIRYVAAEELGRIHVSDEVAIEKLLASIQQHGQLRPVQVELVDGNYRVLDGRKRVEALRRLGRTVQVSAANIGARVPTLSEIQRLVSKVPDFRTEQVTEKKPFGDGQLERSRFIVRATGENVSAHVEGQDGFVADITIHDLLDDRCNIYKHPPERMQAGKDLVSFITYSPAIVRLLLRRITELEAEAAAAR